MKKLSIMKAISVVMVMASIFSAVSVFAAAENSAVQAVVGKYYTLGESDDFSTAGKQSKTTEGNSAGSMSLAGDFKADSQKNGYTSYIVSDPKLQ